MFENVAGDSITVVAAESCRVWFMSAEHLTRRCEKACTHHSRLVENMFHIMTDKAAALSERVEVLSRRSIREKLLCYFGLQTGGDDCGQLSSALYPQCSGGLYLRRPQCHDAGAAENEGGASGGNRPGTGDAAPALA